MKFVLEFILALLAAARVFLRSRHDTALEILALRQQAAVLKRKRLRPRTSRGLTALSCPTLLGKVSEQTGGLCFAVDNQLELPGVATRIAVELRNQYVLGYRSDNTPP